MHFSTLLESVKKGSISPCTRWKVGIVLQRNYNDRYAELSSCLLFTECNKMLRWKFAKGRLILDFDEKMYQNDMMWNEEKKLIFTFPNANQ